MRRSCPRRDVWRRAESRFTARFDRRGARFEMMKNGRLALARAKPFDNPSGRGRSRAKNPSAVSPGLTDNIFVLTTASSLSTIRP